MNQNFFTSSISPQMQYTALFEALPGSCILLKNNPPHYTILAATPEYLKQTGYAKEVMVGKGIFEAFPANPDDPTDTGESDLKASFAHVRMQKELHELPVQRYDIAGKDEDFSKRYWRAINKPVFNSDGEVDYIIHSAEDITIEVMSGEIKERMEGLEKEHKLFMQAPVPIQIYKGDSLIVELANEPTLTAWGKGKEVIGRPLSEVLPGLEGQGVIEILQEVIRSGKQQYLYDIQVDLIVDGREEVRYYNNIYQPYYEENKLKPAGVMVFGFDVTGQVMSRKKLEEVTERLNFRNALFEAQNETTPDGLLVVNPQGKMILHNKRFVQIWNMPVEIMDSKDDEAALRHAMTMLKDPPGFLNRVTHLYQTQKEKSYDRIQFKDGRIIERFGTAITAENGLRYGWAWYFRDISERKKQEEEIEAQNVLIKTITDNATSTLFMMNAGGYCTFMNAAGEKMFGYSQVEIRSKPLHYLIHHKRPDGSFYPKDECPLDRALPENFDVRAHRDLFFRKDGTSFPVSCAASPIFEEGVPVATVIEVRDITLEVEAEQALRRSAEELEQMVGDRTIELQKLNEQLQQFTYAASHDLQEPLRKIRVFLDKLLTNIGPKLNEDDIRLSERIKHTTDRMRRLINDLLAYSNTAMGSTVFTGVELKEIVKEVLDDMEATVTENSAVINIGPLPKVKGDARQLRQLFQNLISNALKYRRKDELPQVEITSKLVNGSDIEAPLSGERSKDRFYLVEVKDNGIGFDPIYADSIFGLFQRLHGKAEFEGTGIGLAIVQKVVDNHNGYIWAKSKSGEGATFKIMLPVD